MAAPVVPPGQLQSYNRPHAPGSFADLTFKPQPMVSWFDPGQLLRTGTHTLISTVFGAFADRREIQAALEDSGVLDGYSFVDGEFWFDFVADTGDGFDSTYSVAYVLGRPELTVRGTVGDEAKHAITMPRGRLLVMGGDEVYPMASPIEYRDRLCGPFEAALPYCDDEPPHLFAIPGNHDWYDGLASFLRLFCQRRWIGGWATRQSRSYFAVKLPGRWSLWGVDLQLHAEIDKPQLEFFREAARQIQQKHGPGEKIILCTAEPCWVAAGLGKAEPYDKLEFFMREIIAAQGARVALVLTGDLHHYSRYEQTHPTEPHDACQLITAGGGGAFLAPTHHLPYVLHLPLGPSSERPRKSEEFRRAETFPSCMQSRFEASKAIRFLNRNRSFTALLGGLYLVYLWLFEVASRRVPYGPELKLCGEPLVNGRGFLWQLRTCTLVDSLEILSAGFFTMVLNPASFVFSLLIVGALGAFGASGWRGGHKWPGAAVGVAHGVLHVALGFLLLWLVALTLGVFGLAPSPRLTAAHWSLLLLIVVPEVLLLGAVCGGILMGIYLTTTNLLLGMHDNETFSSQAIEQYKNFLRIRIDEKQGTATVYALGLRAVHHDWEANPLGGGDAPLVLPRNGAPQCELIEKITVRG